MPHAGHVSAKRLISYLLPGRKAKKLELANNHRSVGTSPAEIDHLN